MSNLKARRRGPRIKTGAKVLPPMIPNAGIAAAYQKKLLRLVREMDASVKYWVEATYRNNEPILAMDEVPAKVLEAAVKKLVRRWQRKFNRAAKDMAEHFSQNISDRVDGRLGQILKDSGWTVKFRMTEAQRDVLGATVNQNVSLIKSIPAKYLSNVEGMVARAVQVGGDLGSLSKNLQESFGVTKRRAALICHDQSRKATSALTNARYRELGIEESVWVHSTAGKEPRPTHLANDGKKYKTSEGWYDPAVKKYIFPGELINCRCFSRAVIPGFS